MSGKGIDGSSAVNRYAKHGNKSGIPTPGPTSDTTLWDIADNGVQAAGIFSVPLCGIG